MNYPRFTHTGIIRLVPSDQLDPRVESRVGHLLEAESVEALNMRRDDISAPLSPDWRPMRYLTM